MKQDTSFTEYGTISSMNNLTVNVDKMLSCEPVTKLLGIVRFSDKGRGVVTLENIKCGTALERAVVGTFPSDERQLITGTKLFEWYFVQPREYNSSHIIPDPIGGS